jgi:hypothetical protein
MLRGHGGYYIEKHRVCVISIKTMTAAEYGAHLRDLTTAQDRIAGFRGCGDQRCGGGDPGDVLTATPPLSEDGTGTDEGHAGDHRVDQQHRVHVDQKRHAKARIQHCELIHADQQRRCANPAGWFLSSRSKPIAPPNIMAFAAPPTPITNP